jgi:hypothetical protein
MRKSGGRSVRGSRVLSGDSGGGRCARRERERGEGEGGGAGNGGSPIITKR